MSGIRVFNKAISTLQESQKNLQAISAARQKIEQDKERFEFEKKEQAFKLEKMQREGKMSELEYDILSGQQKEYQKQEQDKMKGAIASIKMAEHQSRNMAEQAMNWAKVGFKSDPQGVLGYLGAMKRNQQRTQELRPKMSYGKMGFDVVDVNGGEDVESESDRLSLEGKRLDVAEKKKRAERGIDPEKVYDVASKLADNEIVPEGVSKSQHIESFMPKAKELLSGQSQESGVNYSKQGKQGSDNGKVKVRLKNGRTGSVPKDRLKFYLDNGAEQL